MQVTGSHPVLAVHDLERAADWFVGLFGAERIDVDPGNWVFCRAGAVTFMLGLCPDAQPASEIGDHSYVAYVDVDDVDACHRRAIATGVEVIKAPVDEPWGRREMGVRSPDGHRFMVASRGA